MFGNLVISLPIAVAIMPSTPIRATSPVIATTPINAKGPTRAIFTRSSVIVDISPNKSSILDDAFSIPFILLIIAMNISIGTAIAVKATIPSIAGHINDPTIVNGIRRRVSTVISIANAFTLVTASSTPFIFFKAYTNNNNGATIRLSATIPSIAFVALTLIKSSNLTSPAMADIKMISAATFLIDALRPVISFSI